VKNPHQDGFDATTHQVDEVVALVAERPIPSFEADLQSIGIDSIAMLDILALLEERFDILLNETSAKDFRTIQDISRIVKELVRAR
jgi:acyl carrier protein